MSLFLLSTGAGAATLHATYTFDNSLAAQQSGVPSLTATNPLGSNAFLADTVYGTSRSVYAFNGNATPVAQQAGLTFSGSTGMVSPNSYSLALVFELPTISGFRRVVDTKNRQSDNGVYIAEVLFLSSPKERASSWEGLGDTEEGYVVYYPPLGSKKWLPL